MSYELVLHQPSAGATKAVAENTFLADLPAEFQVYCFYYPAEMPDPEFERLIRRLGDSTGNNLFVNIGRLDDPQFDKIVKAFGIKSFPSVVMTAVTDLAAAEDELMSAYVRLDGRMLADSQRAIKSINELFLLFLTGAVAGAIRKAGRRSRAELARNIGNLIMSKLSAIGRYVADRDFSVSIMGGSFEIKKSGS